MNMNIRVVLTISLSEEEQKHYTPDDLERHQQDIIKILPDELHTLARRLRQRGGVVMRWGFDE